MKESIDQMIKKARQLKICDKDPACSLVLDLVDEVVKLRQALADAKVQGVRE